MSDFKPLGKPLPRPVETKVKPIEEVAPGIYRVDGKLETWIPGNQAAKAPVYTPQQIQQQAYEHMLEILKKQQDDGFPINEFGVM